MTEMKAVEILKSAIIMEQKGKSFYEAIAGSTKSVAVREIFNSMAMEEVKHIEMLKEQYVHLTKDGKLKLMTTFEKPSDFAKEILTAQIKKEITGASYEAAAISAAVTMEKQAVEFYSGRAKSGDDEAERSLFDWLANWEKGHVDLLVAIDNQLKESIWHDAHFWPVI
jgi:rubrerythrin